MRKPTFLITILFATIVALSLLRVVFVNNISTDGIELAEIQKQIITYQKENAYLKEKYLQEASLVQIEAKAKSLGFVDAKTQIYLSTPLPLALR